MATKKQNTVGGKYLVPDFDKLGMGAVSEEVLCHVGVHPDAPFDMVDISGIMFPKRNEMLDPNPNDPGTLIRVPVWGALVRITEAKVAQLVEAIPRTVVRVFKVEPKRDDTMGTDMLPKHRPAIRSQLITIPSEETVKLARENKRHLPTYVPQPGDEPVAKFIYCWPVMSQDAPERFQFPQKGEIHTLDKMGLEWPLKYKPGFSPVPAAQASGQADFA